jgi:hypothetical protein
MKKEALLKFAKKENMLIILRIMRSPAAGITAELFPSIM